MLFSRGQVPSGKHSRRDIEEDEDRHQSRHNAINLSSECAGTQDTLKFPFTPDDVYSCNDEFDDKMNKNNTEANLQAELTIIKNELKNQVHANAEMKRNMNIKSGEICGLGKLLKIATDEISHLSLRIMRAKNVEEKDYTIQIQELMTEVYKTKEILTVTETENMNLKQQLETANCEAKVSAIQIQSLNNEIHKIKRVLINTRKQIDEFLRLHIMQEPLKSIHKVFTTLIQHMNGSIDMSHDEEGYNSSYYDDGSQGGDCSSLTEDRKNNDAQIIENCDQYQIDDKGESSTQAKNVYTSDEGDSGNIINQEIEKKEIYHSESQMSELNDQLLVTKDFACNLCGKTFKHRYSVQRHVKEKHLIRPKVEGLRAEIPCNLRQNENVKGFACKECGKIFKLKYNVYRHTRQKHCIKSNDEDLKVEIRQHPNEEAKDFSCTICGKTFKVKYNVVRHTRRTHGIEPIKLDDEDLKAEIPRRHSREKEDVNGFSCKECGKTFKVRSSVYRHVKRNHFIPKNDEGLQVPIPPPPPVWSRYNRLRQQNKITLNLKK